MSALDITPEEVASGEMSPEHLRQAVTAIRDDGFVILNGVVDIAHLDVLHAKMLEDLRALQQREDAPYNWNAGNIQQDPPPFPPYLFKDVLLNDMVIAVTKTVLGPGVKSTFYGGNTAIKSKERQPVHGDTGHLWPAEVMEIAHPPAQLVVNIPTVDVSPENGSTEIWPGTHRDLAVVAGKDIKVPAAALERRRAIHPPIQPTFKRGGVLIRDMRLWHAGMPNRTDAPRPMIAMIHNCGWLETGDALTLPKGTEEFFKHPDLRTVARFVDEPIDHISTPHGYEYDRPAK